MRSKTYLIALSMAMALQSFSCFGSQTGEMPADVNKKAEKAAISILSVPDAFTAVTGQIVGDHVTPVLGSDNKWHVVYELILTNGRPIPASVLEIDVVDYNNVKRVLRTLTEAEIVASGVNLSGRPRPEPETHSPPGDDVILQPNESMVLFIELEFDTESEVPEAIVHHFSGIAATNPGSRKPSPVDYLMVPLALNEHQLPLVGPPLEGNGWAVINGCCSPAGAHRGSLQTISGRLRVAQRFAVDWMKIGANGKFFEGDPANVANWHNYGEPVLAVADGTVVEVLDELDDQPPGTLPDPTSITINTVDGNHVILDIGGGVYVFYAHLKRGSVSVKKGDIVRMGDSIGQLGNSGNTSAPHLHIHFMDNPSALAADGIPYRYLGFEVTGGIDPDQWASASEDLDETWNILPPPDDVPAGPFMPMDLNVGGFSTDR